MRTDGYAPKPACAKALLREYYATAGDKLELENISRREFALLDGSFMRRHLQFDNMERLVEALADNLPTALYALFRATFDSDGEEAKGRHAKPGRQECSHTWKLTSVEGDHHECPACGTINDDSETSAGDPQKSMDLAFDIDYGDIPGTADMTPVRKLAAASRSAYNLYVLLTEDFGVAEDDIVITFSGGKGMHVRVAGGGLHTLGEPERKALVDYVSGYSFTFGDFISIRATKMSGNTWHLKGYQSGWGKRFNDSVLYFIALAKKDGDDFDKALEMYWPWHETKDKYGQKKLPSDKVRAAFKQSCAEADHILKGGDIRKMKDAEAKRLLSLALSRSLVTPSLTSA